MAVRSTSLAFGRAVFVASTYVIVYTVPAGRRTIVKEMCVTRETGSAGALYFSVERTSVTVDAGHEASLTLGEFQRFPVWLVLNAGDRLKMVSSTAGTLTWIISGTELLL